MADEPTVTGMTRTYLSSAILATALSFAAAAPLFSAEPPKASTAPLPGPKAKGTDPEIVGEEKAVLTFAPAVPPSIGRKHATKVLVDLEVIEVVKKMAAGVDYLFWTFGGEVPGNSFACSRAISGSFTSATTRQARCRTTSTCTR